jgi:hypothetical protein
VGEVPEGPRSPLVGERFRMLSEAINGAAQESSGRAVGVCGWRCLTVAITRSKMALKCHLRYSAADVPSSECNRPVFKRDFAL